MTALFLIVVIILWFIAGAFAYAMCLEDSWEHRDVGPSPDGLAILLFLSGPVGLMPALIVADRPYKLRWKRWRYEYCSNFTKQWLAERRGISVEELR